MPKHVYNAEDNRPDIMPPGVYPVTVREAEDQISKTSGNEMIKVTLELENGNWVFDYLTFGSKQGEKIKIDTFITATGQAVTKGEEIDLKAAECVGKRAFVELGIEHDENGKYPDKNRVLKYITDKGQPPALPF